MNSTKNEIYFMGLATLAVWKEGGLKNFYGIVTSNSAEELVDVQAFAKNNFENQACLSSVFFSQDIDFQETKIFTTFVPRSSFIKCAVSKGVKSIVYLAKKAKNYEPDDLQICQHFSHNFGRLVDLFGGYTK